MSVSLATRASSKVGDWLVRTEVLLSGFWFRGSEVLSLKSWVTAMPMLAKEREVRSHAKKVRSIRSQCMSH